MDLEVIITSYEGSGPARRLVNRSNVTIADVTAQEAHEVRTRLANILLALEERRERRRPGQGETAGE